MSRKGQAPNVYYCYNDAKVRPVAANCVINEGDRKDCIILIMGPTGAGKSRFIEVLAGDDTLCISKDQLDSVTQEITMYEVVPHSTWHGVGKEITSFNQRPEDIKMILLDTPGFSDSQISELEIIVMVREWMKAHNCKRINYIFYFCPITDIRLSRSRRRTIEMLKSLCAINASISTPGDFIVATTMWDRLSNERSRKSAEERHEQLKNSIWKDLVDDEGCFAQFMNTRQSAIDVMHQMLVVAHSTSTRGRKVAFQDTEVADLRKSPSGRPLYQDLLERIQNSQQHQHVLEMELADPETQTNPELRSLTELQLHRNTHVLTKFETQLIKFGDPPAGFEDIVPMRQAIMDRHQRRSQDYQDLMHRIKVAQEQKLTLEWELTEPEAQTDPAFKSYTEQRLRIHERLLARSEAELIQFGDPPDGFEDTIPIRKQILDKHQHRATPDASAMTEPSSNSNRASTPQQHIQDQSSVTVSPGSAKRQSWTDRGLKLLKRKLRK